MDAAAQLDRVRTGPLAGRVVAFTGTLASMGREEAERLIRSLGGVPAPRVTSRTDLLIVGTRGWPLREDGRVSHRLEQARRGRGRGWRVRVIPESEFLRLAGRDGLDSDAARPFTLAQAAEASGAPPADIRRWELAGLVSARDGLYDFQDLVSLRAIADLRRRGVALRTIQESLDGLREVLPGVRRPLAQLTLLESDGGSLLAQVGESLLLPSGQHVMDFDGRAQRDEDGTATPGRAATIGTQAPESWDEALDRGLELEDQGRYADAADAYRRAIALRAGSAAAHFNLANALEALGRAEGAEEMYRVAVAIDPGLEIAWYNLGVLLDASGRHGEASTALERAVAASPAFADARFNLAACLHDSGRREEAAPHWRAYLHLDPSGEWADVARRSLGEGRP